MQVARIKKMASSIHKNKRHHTVPFTSRVHRRHAHSNAYLCRSSSRRSAPSWAVSTYLKAAPLSVEHPGNHVGGGWEIREEAMVATAVLGPWVYDDVVFVCCGEQSLEWPRIKRWSLFQKSNWDGLRQTMVPWQATRRRGAGVQGRRVRGRCRVSKRVMGRAPSAASACGNPTSPTCSRGGGSHGGARAW